jgi:hypothetical protein
MLLKNEKPTPPTSTELAHVSFVFSHFLARQVVFTLFVKLGSLNPSLGQVSMRVRNLRAKLLACWHSMMTEGVLKLCL